MALQVLIALSPVLEKRDTVRRDTHVEQSGRQHLFAHDDTTCTICAVRTLVGNAPAAPAACYVAEDRNRVDIAYIAEAGSVGGPQDNHSRAPPTLG